MSVYSRFFLLITATVLMALSSCLDNEENPVSQPVAEPGPTDSILKPAVIHSVEIQVAGTVPDRVSVVVDGQLPNTCSTIDQITQSLYLSTFEIEIQMLELQDPECSLVSTPYKEVIYLDVAGFGAGTYSVDVNGHRGSFELQEEDLLKAGSAVFSGRVWHDLCAVGIVERGGEPVPSSGCLARKDGGFAADGQLEPGEPGIGGLTVTLGQGPCPSSGLALTITDDDGLYLFSGLNAGTYCASVDLEHVQNASNLLPGEWTFPSREKSGFQSVSIAIGEIRGSIDFGWDYEYLPLPVELSSVCSNSAKFINDLNIPDDTIISAGETFTKTWLLVNNGSCDWGPGYRLVFDDGDQLDSPEEIPLPQLIAAGGTVELSAVLKAPLKPGNYRGEWMLQPPDGIRFGVGTRANKPIWVQIVVGE